MTKVGVALQLYTVRDQTAKDYVGTLREVAKMGYPGVEIAGGHSFSAAELRRVLDDLGLKVAGSHIGIEKLEEDIDREIEYNLAIGNRDLVCPYLPEPRRRDAAGYRATAATLSALGAKCRQRGARLSYHNHSFEFVRFDGEYGLDILLGSADPAAVNWEADVYWLQHGGVSPADYLRRYSGRIPLVHLKDMLGDATRAFAEVGEGIVDFRSVFAAGEASGAEWYIVEQDICRRPSLESAKLSLEHLKEWGKL